MNNAIQNVINEGIKLLGEKELNNEMLMAWVQYSTKILNLASPNNLIKIQYSSTIANTVVLDSSPHEKLNQLLQFLIQSIPLL